METGFPCIPSIEERKEGGGMLMWEGCLFDIVAQGMGGYLGKSEYYSIDNYSMK